MKKFKFSDQKPELPGLYLVKAGSDNNCVLLVTITEVVGDCEDCDGSGVIGRDTCCECDGTGGRHELCVSHPDYYNFVESESLRHFHTDGPDSKPKKNRKPDLWSENLEGAV